MTESKQTISWEKEGHIFCGFRFSSSFQKIDMILLTRPEGCLIGLIIFITVTPEKHRTADNCGYFFLFSFRGLSKQQGQIQVATKGATRREEPNGRFWFFFCGKRGIY